MPDAKAGHAVVQRLKRRADFLAVSRARRSAGMPGVVLQVAPNRNASETLRVGFTASKKVGGAVQRNRAKRKLRELAATVLPMHGEAGMDYVLIARNTTPDYPYLDLKRDFERAMKRLKVWRSDRDKG